MVGDAEPGTRLLPENQLSDLLGVSPPTIRKAIDELVECGTLTRLPRRGVFTSRRLTARPLTICFLHIGEVYLTNPFEAVLHRQLQTEAEARGAKLVSLSGEDTGHLPSALAGADGLILRCRLEPALLPLDKPVVIPFVSDHIAPNASYVLPDDYLGGMTACRHLIGLGHRSLAFVGHAQREPMTNIWQRERYHGVCDVAAAEGLGRPLYVNPEGAALSPEMFAPMIDHGVTGVVCANDNTAMAVISCLHKAGARVPEDISVVGFDDLPSAASFVPALSTLRNPVALIVATTLDELERRIKEPAGGVARKIVLPMELIERDSSRPVHERSPAPE
jgi:DNA-binding LacI/PurR family transcriptional regulator